MAASLAAAKNTLMNAQNRVTNAQLAVDKAQAALTAKQDNSQNKPEISKIQTQLNSENAILSEATDNLTKAQSDHGKIMTEMNSETELAALYSAISDAQSALDKLTADGGNKITAPVSGVVSNITITKGQTVAAEETLMTITGKDNGYTATITVTSEQAKRVKTGDTADINESWYYSDIAATVTAIRNDKENPGKSKLIDLKVTGDVTEGTTLNFAIGDKSKTYDMIVPNGAVREDNNGKFILIIREKSSPLGNRYFAKRIDVDVTASDDVNSAVTGELEGYEYVITTSTKAIKAGDQVRLKKS
ncbi:MAG: efflux RND transporter periplasmic adaptor subunit [Candidatus Gastranaerophilaceae bacterium]